MRSVWVEGVGRSLDEALDGLASAVRDCPDELWESSMWTVPGDLFGAQPPGVDGKPVTDLAQRDALVQRRSTPWSVAWHALETVDYDLTGELGPWAPPSPFAGHPHWLLTTLPHAWTRSEIAGYVEYCRRRVRDTLADVTEAQAATPLPKAHRYRGRPHAWIIAGSAAHTAEHAAQIRQFITDRAAAVSASRP